ADVLAAQPVTTNLLKFMRASIKMIGVSNLQSFIASMTQKLTLSDISDESDRKSGSAGMPRPISYAVFCLKKKKKHYINYLYIKHTDKIMNQININFIKSFV